MFYLLYKRKTKEFIELAKNNPGSLEEDDGYRTFLQYACYKGLTDIVEVLLDLNVNPIGKSHVLPLPIDEKMAESYIMGRLLDKCDQIRDSQKPPLRLARRKYRPKILRMLLMHPLIGGETNNNGNTALHIAVKLQADQFSLTEDDKISIIETLLDDNKKDINAINKEGQTPLDLAIAEGNEDILINIIIRKFQYWEVKDFHSGGKLYEDQSFREKLEKKYPKIVLFYFLHYEKTEEFIDLAKKIDRKVLEEEIYGLTLLQHACLKNLCYRPKNCLTKIVKTLLDEGVNPNGTGSADDINSPLAIAVRTGSHEIVEILLENPRLRKIQPDFLYWVREINEKPCYHPGKINCMKCLKLLWPRVARDNLDNYDWVHKNGSIILNFFQYSTKADDNFILELLKLHPFIGGINKYGNHTFMHVKPVLLEKYLDNCIDYRNNLIHFNYKSFVPPGNLKFSAENQINKNQSNDSLETGLFLKMGSLPKFRQLLKHPVITSFLNLKWLAMRKFFFINLIFYSVFCILLTVYVSSKYVSWSSTDSSQNSNVYQSYIFDVTNSKPNMTESFKSDPAYVIMLHRVTVLFWVIFSLREVVQLCFSPLWYVKCLENWIEMSIILTVGFILFQTLSVDYRLLTIVTLLSWGEAVLLIGRHPKLSIYLRMFKTVTRNFLALLLFYGILILAFALSFYFLSSGESRQSEDNPFENPLVAFFKIFIMMTGEFDSSEFPFQKSPLLGRIIFLSFVFFIAIVLLSLLNGLAVGDIQTIRSDAELLEIIYRIEMFQYYESMPVLNMLSNMFDSLTKLEWLNDWTREKCKILESSFSMALFPNVMENYKSYVDLEYYNAVYFQPADFRHYHFSRLKRFSMWKIDSDIVEAAKRLDEKKIQDKKKIKMEDLFALCSEQLKLYESKFETNEKMRMECCVNLHAVRKISKRLDGVEQISESNEKKIDKLLRTVASIRVLVRDRVPCTRKTFSSRSVRPVNRLRTRLQNRL